MTHKIKIKYKYYKAVLNGNKTFEIRKNDRDYKVGDIIHFVPVADDSNMIIPHNPNEYKITYVFHGGEYGLEEAYCVFGIVPTEKKEVVHAFNNNKNYSDVDEFRCSECGIHLEDWVRHIYDEDTDDEYFQEYVFKYCPNCGCRMKEGAE